MIDIVIMQLKVLLVTAFIISALWVLQVGIWRITKKRKNDGM
jgi:hypothetical protein